MTDKLKFLIDKEINLKKTDFLNTKIYSDTLCSLIKNSPDGPFTIGLFGEWGSGKSSVIDTTIKSLKAEKNNFGFVLYDAWKYSKDSFRRMFLFKTQEALQFKKQNLFNSFYLNENEDVKIKNKFKWSGLLIFSIILFIALLIFIICSFVLNWSFNSKVTLSVITSLIAIIISFSLNVFNELKVNIQKSRFFAPEQFEECFYEMVQKVLQHNNIIKKVSKWVCGEKYLKNLDKLIIVFDNIDRCSEKLAYDLLTDIKTFLGKDFNIIFIIPVDDVALKSHIKYMSGRYSDNNESEEFLRKFFNVTIRIKPFKTIDLFDYAKKINDTEELGFNNTTIDIIAQEYATNPRRIIQLYNNLSTEIELISKKYSKDFAIKNESIIARLLIIREEWPELYKKFCFNPHLIKDDSFSIFDNTDHFKKIESAKNFLRKTYAVIRYTPQTIIDKLLSNADNMYGLTEETIEKLNKFDTNDLSNYLKKNNTNYSPIKKYIIDRLEKGVIRELFKTDVINNLSILFKLNEIIKFNEFDIQKIENIISSYLEKIIENIENIKDLILFVDFNISKNRYYLIDHLINQINNIKIPDKNPETLINSFWVQILFETVKIINEKKYLIKIKNQFIEFYKLSNKTLKSFNIPNENIKILSDSTIYLHIISKIPNLELLEEDNLQDFIYFISINSIKHSEVIKLFEHFESKYPNLTNRQNQYITTILNIFNEIFKNIPTLNFSSITSIQKFINKLLNTRQVNNTNVIYINEIISQPENINQLIKMLFEIYRITSEKINILPYIQQIYNANKEYKIIIYENILNLLEDNFLCKCFFDILLKEKEINEKLLLIYEKIFINKSNDTYILENTKLETTLNYLIQQSISDNDYSEKIMNFLNNIASNIRIKEIFVNNLKGIPKEKILSFPDNLQIISFDFIIEENDRIFEYENDKEILKAMLSKGESKYTDVVVKVITRKIPKEEELPFVIELLESVENGRENSLKRLIPMLEDHKKNEDYKDKINDILNSLNN
jgi:hypothetical protein